MPRIEANKLLVLGFQAVVALVATWPFLAIASDSAPPSKEPSKQPVATKLASYVPKAKPVAPPTREALDTAITRGVDFILKIQNPSGSWGSATQTKDLNIYAPVPGAHDAFRAAVTALCVSALIDSADARPEVASSIDRGEAWLLENLPKVRRNDITALYNNWTHAYGIEAMVRLWERHEKDPARQKAIRDVIVHQVDRLNRYQYGAGGWGYYDFDTHLQHPGEYVPSFTTATVLLALKEARRVGVEVPESMVTRGVRTVVQQQKPDFTYLYSGNFWKAPMRPINQPGGSLGRSQVCNLALRQWGDKRITDEVLEECLDRLFARNLWLDIGRKRPIPHESYFQVAGYFYYYGSYYAAQCIDELPAEKRPPLKAQLAFRLLPLQEKDGSWWDFPLYNYHQQYGTAMGVMSLVRCRAK
ncbi:MAG: hypothetical protein K8T91_27730 [Planctomycetes bacterium]|nr:hypothetical protein [Planctomycetota bacterium]